MAIVPTFIADMATVKTKLRLTGAQQPDALALIDTAVQQGRLYLMRQLGADRVAALQAKPYDENTMTSDGVQRLKANAAELAIIKIYLLRTMPTLFTDASAGKQGAWNDEGFARNTPQDKTDEEIARLQYELDTWLLELLNDDGVTEGVLQGGVMIVPQPVDSPIPVNRSIQGGFYHRQDQYRAVTPPGIYGGTF